MAGREYASNAMEVGMSGMRLGLSLVLSTSLLAAIGACGVSADIEAAASSGDAASPDAAPPSLSDASADAAAPTDASDAATADGGVSAPAPASRQLAIGNLHSCAVRAGGKVKCWGASADLQLGPLGDGNPSTSPHDVGLTDVVEVSAGYDFSCARKSDGHVWCWGSGMGGQLGNGQKTKSKDPVEVTGLTDAVAITSNWAHTCALRANGHIACWGNGGRIGDGTSDEMLVPKEPPGIVDVESVVVGWGHTCVVLAGGTAKCWGTYNAWGQLGDGTKQDRLSPVDVKDLATASSIVSGSYHVCALLTGKTVSCWGNAQAGQIGTGVTGDSPHWAPEAVPNLANVDQLDAKGVATCARVVGGDVYCWGGGPIGEGTDSSTSPLLVTTLGKDVAQLAVGNNHHCVQLASGEIRCWGHNGYRQLGDGTTTPRPTPVTVQGL